MKKIKIMVDWNGSEVVTKEEFEARKAGMKKYLGDADDWNEWLTEKYSLSEVFDMTEQEKEKERAEYLADVEHRALEEVMQDIEYVTLDLDDVIFIED